MISVQNVSGGYPNHHVLKNVSFTVRKGELFGILGPNGSGKTTLLKMISGLLLPSEGDIQIEDRSLQEYTPKQLAKLVAVLPQVSSEFFAYTVKETVMLGRYAHQKGWFYSTNARDETIVQEAMTMTGVEKFQAKLLQELSGGERQRVFLAQALAQEPSILLLDEPTNHLDLSYQKDLLDQLKKWTIDRDMSVISIFHDVNLASLYCDRLLLLNEGEVEVLGDANTVLQEKNIVNVYETDIVKQPHPQVPQPQMLLLPDIYGSEGIVHSRFLKESEQRIEYQSPVPLKTIAMGVLSGGGMGWHQTIVSSVKEENEKTGTIYTSFDASIERIFIENIVILQSVKQVWIFIHGTLTDLDFVELLASLATIRALAGKPAETIIIGATQTGNSLDWKVVLEKIKPHI